MGLKSWWHGHGWDGTRETPAEQHTRAMHEQVEAWKARWDERTPRDRRPTIAPRGVAETVQRELRAVEQAFGQEMAAVRRVLEVHENEYGHRARDSGDRPQPSLVHQVAHVLQAYHARGRAGVTDKMLDHGARRAAWAREAIREHPGAVERWPQDRGRDSRDQGLER